MSHWSMNDDEFDRAYALGLEGEAIAAGVEPRATSARYEAGTGRLVIEFAAGFELVIPIGLINELRSLSAEDLALVRVSPGGEGLEWEHADVHISVPGLTWSLVGSREHARQVIAQHARRAASTRTEAKAAAARENGKKGGRPRKRPSVAEAAPRLSIGEEA